MQDTKVLVVSEPGKWEKSMHKSMENAVKYFY